MVEQRCSKRLEYGKEQSNNPRQTNNILHETEAIDINLESFINYLIMNINETTINYKFYHKILHVT